MKGLVISLWLPLAFAVACSETASSPSTPPATSSSPDDGSSDTATDASTTGDANPGALACAPVSKKTKCRTGGDSAIIRGVARFDPAQRDVGSKTPTLSLFLRHSFILDAKEEKLGGRLHAYKRIALGSSELASGLVPFELDLCEQDVSMWSEENGLFNVVAILDENDAHDVDKATSVSNALVLQTPAVSELVHMVTGVDVSCHGDSPCLDVPLDCREGTTCTTITPIDKVDCRTPSCPSDQSFCKGGAGH